MKAKISNEIEVVLKKIDKVVREKFYEEVDNIEKQRYEEVKKASIIIAQETVPEFFLYQYGVENIDPVNIKNAITSITIDENYKAIIKIDTSAICFIPKSEPVDMQWFNLNATREDFFWDNDEIETDEKSLSFIEDEAISQMEDTESQIYVNNKRWKKTSWYSWTNKRERTGGFQSVEKTAEQSKEIVQQRLQKQKKNKIDAIYDKKIKEKLNSFIKGVK